MDLEELKTNYPAVYAEARAEGVEEGAGRERERCKAHLTLAEASGDTKTALEAIQSGEGITDGVLAKHHAAGITKGQIEARGAEAPPSVDVSKPAPATKSDLEAKAAFEAANPGWEVSL